MILLDSSIIIDLFRKQNKVNSKFFKLTEEYSTFFISSISVYEIGIGNRALHMEYWNKLLNQLTILPFDANCANEAVKVYSNLRNGNKLIDIADILIGATSIANNLPLATLNNKHFERIDKLIII